jgi:hypothetical protein
MILNRIREDSRLDNNDVKIENLYETVKSKLLYLSHELYCN